MRLPHKTAIITGAASGMGLADARRFVQEGAQVVLTDQLAEAGQALAEQLTAEGHQVLFVPHDVSDPAQWDAVVQATLQRFGRIDILVNNAGISGSAVPDVTELDLFDRLIAVNLRGTFLGIRAVVPSMAAAGGGAIVNISSICSHVGTPGVHVGYHASKGGIRALTKAAAAQYGPQKIRVNSIHPGAMPPMRDRAADHARCARARDRPGAAAPRRRGGRRGQHGAFPGLGRVGLHHRGRAVGRWGLPCHLIPAPRRCSRPGRGAGCACATGS
jgi:NAD(P)-dependent dehydrogenase (short-subunit alcohol dehydrogenase family)